MTDSVQWDLSGRQRSSKRIYYHLFVAQAIALVSTGIATVGLALLAYDLAGDDAGAILGTALAIKMLAYIGIAPIAAALAQHLPRRALLICLDLVWVAVALGLPFVTQVWQIYVLAFIFQAASAAFAPTYQATIPDLLPDEKAYTRALSRSRLAFELEGITSPALAAGLLLLVSFPGLFVGTGIGFLVSAALLIRVRLPPPTHGMRGGFHSRAMRGLRIFLATPRLRGLLALSLAVAAATAMVVVNTVVLVQASFGLSERATAVALIAFGAGSIIAALAVPRLLELVRARTAMLAGGGLIVAGLIAGVIVPGYLLLLLLWFALGLGASLVQTPAGSLLYRSSSPEDRQAVYAAQFALAHACLMLSYPLAGWLGAAAGMRWDFAVLGLIAGAAMLAAARFWPRHDPDLAKEVASPLDDHRRQPNGTAW